MRFLPKICCALRLALIATLTLFSDYSLASYDHHGLLFKSYAHAQNSRTSLDLSADQPFGADNNQIIQFDLSMWQADKFGYIFRALDKDFNKLDLLYLPPYNDQASLKIVYNESIELISLPLSIDQIVRNQWHTIYLSFENGIQLELGDTTISHQQIFAFQSITFGVSQNNKNLTYEIPPFALKNIIYKEAGEVVHHWLLNENSGQTAHDNIGSREVQIFNPNWIYTKYFHWEEKASIEGDMVPGLAYHSKDQSINVINTENMARYFIPHGFQDHVVYSAPLKFSDAVKKGSYNPLTEELLLYDIEPQGVYVYDEINTSWTSSNAPKEVKQQIWKHTSFINPLDSSLFVFGGYGFFTLKNDLWKFDRHQNTWHKVSLTGDKIIPRYHVSAGTGLRQGQFYVFGGIGNESGKQELGQQNLYDLFLIDLSVNTVTKIWELEAPADHFLPTNNLIIDQNDSSFYSLCYRNFETNSNLALIKFSLNKAEYEVISDSIPYSARRMDYSDVLLSLNRPTKELFAAVRMSDNKNQSATKIYSLLFPPTHTKTLIQAKPTYLMVMAENMGWFLLAIVLVLGILAGRKYTRSKSISIPRNNGTTPKISSDSRTQIYLLGGFTLIDNEKDLSKLLSPKLRELFILLLLSYTKEPAGITTKQLTNALWPLMNTAKAKNARGVTIQRLRQVLEKISGLSLTFENERWGLVFSQYIYCDFLHYYHLKSQCQNKPSIQMMQELIGLLKRGILLPNMQLEWLDSDKSEFINDVLDTVMRLTNDLDLKNDSELILQIAQVILIFDDLNDQGLELQIKALVNLGKHGVAKIAFDRFQEKYKSVFDENHEKSFQDLID